MEGARIPPEDDAPPGVVPSEDGPSETGLLALDSDEEDGAPAVSEVEAPTAVEDASGPVVADQPAASDVGPAAAVDERREAAAPTLPEASEEPVEEGAPAWVMTFGDLMSLLLTFFILLFSMSSVEVEKFQAAAQSLQEAFGNLEGQPPPTPTIQMSDSIPIITQTDQIVDDVLEQIRSELQRFISDNQLQDKVLVAKEAEGVFLRIQDATVFLAGAAGIEREGAQVLERLGDITRLIEVPVVVTGHTDDSPINSGVFRSNWELSAVRAAGVARALVERGQNATLVTVEAFSQYRPVAPNDSPAGRAQNRRVELQYSRQGVINTLVDRGLIPDVAAQPVAPAEPAAN